VVRVFMIDDDDANIDDDDANIIEAFLIFCDIAFKVLCFIALIKYLAT